MLDCRAVIQRMKNRLSDAWRAHEKLKKKAVSELMLAPDATLGERVRYYRCLRGYTQEYVALECGTSTSRIRQIEKDLCSPRAATIDKIAEVLEVSQEALMRPTDDFIMEAQQSEFLDNLQRMISIYYGLREEERKIMSVQVKFFTEMYEQVARE